MPWATVAVMVVASLAIALFVSWPLLVGRGDPDTLEDDTPADQLLAQKESVYSAIKELEFDHAMGTLSEEDYRELSRRYEDRAVALLQSIDEVSRTDEDEDTVAHESVATGRATGGRTRQAHAGDAIEQEVASLRAKRRAKAGGKLGRDLGKEIETQVAAMKMARPEEKVARRSAPSPSMSTSPLPVCPACKAPVRDSGAAFCARCGASLRAKCPACGEAVDSDDAFCSSCGARLVVTSSQTGSASPGGTHA